MLLGWRPNRTVKCDTSLASGITLRQMFRKAIFAITAGHPNPDESPLGGWPSLAGGSVLIPKNAIGCPTCPDPVGILAGFARVGLLFASLFVPDHRYAASNHQCKVGQENAKLGCEGATHASFLKLRAIRRGLCKGALLAIDSAWTFGLEP